MADDHDDDHDDKKRAYTGRDYSDDVAELGRLITPDEVEAQSVPYEEMEQIEADARSRQLQLQRQAPKSNGANGHEREPQSSDAAAGNNRVNRDAVNDQNALDELAETALLALTTSAEHAAAMKLAAAANEEIKDRCARFRDLLVEHTPENLALNEDTSAAYTMAARRGSHLRRVSGAWRAWNGCKWVTGREAEDVAHGFAREVGELFSALACEIAGLKTRVNQQLHIVKVLQLAAAKEERFAVLAEMLSSDIDSLDETAAAMEKHGDGDFEKISQRLTSAAGIAAALRVAETFPALRAKASDFDQRLDLLNCANGIVELRTGELLAHDPKYMCSQITETPYDPEAKEPTRWLKFLEEIHPDPDTQVYSARRWGYAITGEMGEQKFWFHHGRGGDGKSAELDAIADVLGDYALKAPRELFVESRKGRSTEVHRSLLVGKRLVYMSEWPNGGELNIDGLKDLTGGSSKLSANENFKTSFNFEPHAKLIIPGNSVPKIGEADATRAFWQRVVRIEYPMSFRGGETEVLAIAKRLVAAEGPSILRWLVQQAVAYYAQAGDAGKTGLLRPSEAIRTAGLTWERESDEIARWIHERCDLAIGYEQGSTQLWESYCTWREVNELKPVTRESFYKKLSDKGYGPVHGRTGNVRLNIALKTARPDLLL